MTVSFSHPSFFHHDKLHLNVHGTRRLLSGINKVIPVTKYTIETTTRKAHEQHISSHKKRSPTCCKHFVICVQNQGTLYNAGSKEETPRDVTLMLGRKWQDVYN